MYGLIRTVNIDGYICILLALILIIPFVFIFLKLSSYKPELSLGEKLDSIFGKGSFVLKAILTVIVLLFETIFMFNLLNFVNSQFLSLTPMLVIGLLFVLLIVFINFKGIETITRTASILCFICILLYLSALIGLIPEVKIDNFKPFLISKHSNIIRGTFYLLSNITSTLFLFLAIPKKLFLKEKKYNKTVVFSVIIAIIILLSIFIVTAGVLGFNLLKLYRYPEYMVLKRLTLFTFIDQIENIIMIQWIFGLFFNCCFGIYFIKSLFKKTVNSKIYTLIISLLLLFIPLFYFKSGTQFRIHTIKINPYIQSSFIVLICLIGIISIFKNMFSKKKFKKEFST
jgi:spore germination protein KB